MKGQLHEARLFLGKRDGATTAQGQYEAGANAKRYLVKAGGLLGNLEEGLKIMTEGDKRGENKVGAGELRRRRDLLGSLGQKLLENMRDMCSYVPVMAQMELWGSIGIKV